MSFTIIIKDRTLTISLPSSANVKVRYNVDEIYSGVGASHVVSLPIKDSMPAEGSYVADIDGVETLLAYSYPKEEPSLIWGENGLLSLIDISDSTVYSGTITAQSLVCTPPLPLAVKSGTNSVHYPPNIYSGLWSVNRKVTVAYDQGNGLVVVKDIDATFTHYVLNINAKNLHEAVTNYINEYVNSCSPCRETTTFTKVNAYMEQYHGYISLCKYEEAYNALVAAGNLVGVSKDVEEIIPFYLSDCGCECDDDIVPAHTAYYGFFGNETITEAQAKTLNVDKYNIHVYRDWHMNQDGLTDRYAYIILPTTVAQMVQLVSINEGLPAEWTNRQTLDIDGQQYTAIRSPYKFFDISMSFKTSKVASSDVALEWINNNGTNLLNHVGSPTLHLTSEEKTQGALATGVVNPAQFTGKDISTTKKLAEQFDLEINNKAEEDGTILYHSQPWTTSGDISVTGSVVTGAGTAFTASMIGSKLKLNSGWYAIVTGYASSTSITVSKDVVGTVTAASGSWGIYSRCITVESGGDIRFTGPNGTSRFVYASNGVLYSGAIAMGENFQLPSNKFMSFSATTSATDTKDVGIKRNSLGVLEINDGATAGTYRDLNIRTLNYSGALNFTSDLRLKKNIRDVSNALDKCLKIANTIKHYEYTDQDVYFKGVRTSPVAQLLIEQGLDGFVTYREPKDELEGNIFGWTYRDDNYEELNEHGAVAVKTRRIVDQKGDYIMQVDNNFTPFAVLGIAELAKENEMLKKRLSIIEDKLGIL